MKRYLHVAGMLALALGAMSLQPARASAGAMSVNGSAPALDCLYYSHYTEGGGTVTCYGAGGLECAICSI